MERRIQRIVFASLMAALICVTTLAIQIPSPLGGYINPGDALIILASSFLSPIYAFFAAAIGSALADVFVGYMLYVPATFAIKGMMALICALVIKKSFSNKVIILAAVGSLLSEIVMIVGYYVFEGFIYGFGASLVNVPFNAIQGGVGVILGTILVRAFANNRILNKNR